MKKLTQIQALEKRNLMSRNVSEKFDPVGVQGLNFDTLSVLVCSSTGWLRIGILVKGISREQTQKNESINKKASTNLWHVQVTCLLSVMSFGFALVDCSSFLPAKEHAL